MIVTKLGIAILSQNLTLGVTSVSTQVIGSLPRRHEVRKDVTKIRGLRFAPTEARLVDGLVAGLLAFAPLPDA